MMKTVAMRCGASLWFAGVLVGCMSTTEAKRSPAVESETKEFAGIDLLSLPALYRSAVPGEDVHKVATGRRELLAATTAKLAESLSRDGVVSPIDLAEWEIEEVPLAVDVMPGGLKALAGPSASVPFAPDLARGPAFDPAEWHGLKHSIMLLAGRLSRLGYYQSARNVKESLLSRRRMQGGYALTQLPPGVVLGATAAMGFWTPLPVGEGADTLSPGLRLAALQPNMVPAPASKSWGEKVLVRNRALILRELARHTSHAAGATVPGILAARTTTRVVPADGSDWHLAFSNLYVETYTVGRPVMGPKNVMDLTLLSYQQIVGTVTWDEPRTARLFGFMCSAESRADIVVDRECDVLLSTWARMGSPGLQLGEALGQVTPFVARGISNLMVARESFPVGALASLDGLGLADKAARR